MAVSTHLNQMLDKLDHIYGWFKKTCLKHHLVLVQGSTFGHKSTPKMGNVKWSPIFGKNMFFVKSATGADLLRISHLRIGTSGICAWRGATSDPETKDLKPAAPGCRHERPVLEQFFSFQWRSNKKSCHIFNLYIKSTASYSNTMTLIFEGVNKNIEKLYESYIKLQVKSSGPGCETPSCLAQSFASIPIFAISFTNCAKRRSIWGLSLCLGIPRLLQNNAKTIGEPSF